MIVFTWIGYAFSFCCALFALLWMYEKAMNNVWKRACDTHDFFEVVKRYAKERHAKRKANRVGFSDE